MQDFLFGVADGARTHDNWNHNPGLYQLSYSHHWLVVYRIDFWRARQDSNLRPLAPEANALSNWATNALLRRCRGVY